MTSPACPHPQAFDVYNPRITTGTVVPPGMVPGMACTRQHFVQCVRPLIDCLLLIKIKIKLGILFYPRPYLLSIVSYWRDQTTPLAATRYGVARGVGRVLGCCSVFTVFFVRVLLLGWPILGEEVRDERVRSRNCCCG
jgi:hypothetical protein